MNSMTRGWLLCTAMITAVSSAAGAQAKSPSAAEQALIQTNETLLQALRTGDLAQLQTLLAADLSYTDASGIPQSRTQLLAAVSSGYRAAAGSSEVTSVRVDGNVGLLSYQTTGDSYVSKTSSVYVMRAGRWQLASQSTTGGAPRAAAVVPAPAPSPTPTQVAVTTPVTVSPTPASTPTQTARTGRTMTGRATGTFDVETKPIPAYNTAPDALVGRMSIDKTFHGDLQGTSKGEMLSAGSATKGSAGYVAIERVTGTLNGKKGSFTLQHTGTMNRGTPSLSITIVPDSGTGELTGITGTMNIIMEGSKHSYQFDYTLPAGG